MKVGDRVELTEEFRERWKLQLDYDTATVVNVKYSYPNNIHLDRHLLTKRSIFKEDELQLVVDLPIFEV